MIDPKKWLVFKNTYFVQLVPPWFWPPRFLQSEVSELLLKMDSGSSIGSSRSGSHTTRYLAAASLAVLHLAGSSLFCSANDMFCILAGADSRLQHCSLQTFFFGADCHRSLRLRLVGWMSPEYAEKFGAFALRDYLSASPLSAAVVVQSSWSVLLGPCNNLFCPDGKFFGATSIQHKLSTFRSSMKLQQMQCMVFLIVISQFLQYRSGSLKSEGWPLHRSSDEDGVFACLALGGRGCWHSAWEPFRSWRMPCGTSPSPAPRQPSIPWCLGEHVMTILTCYDHRNDLLETLGPKMGIHTTSWPALVEVWNLDIVIAMVLEAIVALKAPSPAAILGGLITLGGACLAIQTQIAGVGRVWFEGLWFVVLLKCSKMFKVSCAPCRWLGLFYFSLFSCEISVRQHYLGLHLVLGGNLAVLHHCNHHIQMSQGGLLTYDAVGLGRCDESFGSGTASCHRNCGCHGHIVACLPRCECHGFHVRDQYDVELWLAFFFIIDGSCTSSYGSVSLNASLLGFGFSNAAFFGFACRGPWSSWSSSELVHPRIVSV